MIPFFKSDFNFICEHVNSEFIKDLWLKKPFLSIRKYKLTLNYEWKKNKVIFMSLIHITFHTFVPSLHWLQSSLGTIFSSTSVKNEKWSSVVLMAFWKNFFGWFTQAVFMVFPNKTIGLLDLKQGYIYDRLHLPN